MNILSIAPLTSPQGESLTILKNASFRASAGFPSPAADHYESPISIDELLNLRAPHIWIVEAEGDSMSPCGIMNQSKLILDRSKEAKHGDIIVAILDNQPVVKRLVKSSGLWILSSDNPNYPPIQIDSYESVDVFGVVTWSLTQHA